VLIEYYKNALYWGLDSSVVFRCITTELYLTQASIADTHTEGPMINGMKNAAMPVLIRMLRSVDPDSRKRNALEVSIYRLQFGSQIRFRP